MDLPYVYIFLWLVLNYLRTKKNDSTVQKNKVEKTILLKHITVDTCNYVQNEPMFNVHVFSFDWQKN